MTVSRFEDVALGRDVTGFLGWVWLGWVAWGGVGRGLGWVGLGIELNSMLTLPALNCTFVSMDMLTGRTLVYIYIYSRIYEEEPPPYI